MKKRHLPIYTQIMIGLLVGAGFGILAHRLGIAAFVKDHIRPVGTLFIRLIQMIVVPLVFVSLVGGTASLRDLRKLGRIGSKTLAFYLATTVIAITLGLVLANLFQPGRGLTEQSAELLNPGSSPAGIPPAVNLEKPKIRDTLINIVPTNPIQAMTEGNMLQILFFALMLGIGLTALPAERAAPVIQGMEILNDAILRMIHLIMKTAPYGVFALIAGVFSEFGLGVLMPLLKYFLVVIVALILHVLLVYASAIKLFSPMKIGDFFRGIRPAQLVAFSSSSSSAALPVTMECAEENLGVSRDVSSFALPLGATVNMDGTALYQGVAAVFIAQAYGIHLGIADQLTIILTAALASIGTAGVPGVGIVMLTMVLDSVGIPLEGISLILGVDRFLDMCRTVVNITGDAVCAVIVSSSEGEWKQPNSEE